MKLSNHAIEYIGNQHYQLLNFYIIFIGFDMIHTNLNWLAQTCTNLHRLALTFNVFEKLTTTYKWPLMNLNGICIDFYMGHTNLRRLAQTCTDLQWPIMTCKWLTLDLDMAIFNCWGYEGQQQQQNLFLEAFIKLQSFENSHKHTKIVYKVCFFFA